jgi:CBS domain-containing protein
MLPLSPLIDQWDVRKHALSTPDEQVQTVLDLVKSTYDPVFIFQTIDTLGNPHDFQGLFLPCQALYRHRLFYKSLVAHNVFIPPFLDKDSKISEIAFLMASFRVFTLPIFGDRNIFFPQGTITAHKILASIIEQGELFEVLVGRISLKQANTITRNAHVSDAYHAMRDRQALHMAVIDDKNSLCGVVARSDLEDAWEKPTRKQRFSKRSGNPESFSFDEEQLRREEYPLQKYFRPTTRVIFEQSEHHATVRTALKELCHSSHSSIFIVNNLNQPIGELNYQNVLYAIAHGATVTPSLETPQLSIHANHGLKQQEYAEAWDMLFNFAAKKEYLVPSRRIEVHVETNRTPFGKPRDVQTTVNLLLQSGESMVAKTHSREWRPGLRKAFRELLRQKQSHHNRHPRQNLEI